MMQSEKIFSIIAGIIAGFAIIVNLYSLYIRNWMIWGLSIILYFFILSFNATIYNDIVERSFKEMEEEND